MSLLKPRNRLFVSIVTAIAACIFSASTTAEAALQIPLPGGRNVSISSSGIIRIQTQPSASNNKATVCPPVDSVPSPTVSSAIQVQRCKGDEKDMGYGAFVAAENTVPVHSFLGFYEGDIIVGRENLERLHALEKRSMDYVIALDGGVTFIDGYRRAISDRERFTPAHINHGEGEEANCVRVCSDDDVPRVAFFTKRDVQCGEQLLLDYGRNFWRGRDDRKL